MQTYEIVFITIASTICVLCILSLFYSYISDYFKQLSDKKAKELAVKERLKEQEIIDKITSIVRFEIKKEEFCVHLAEQFKKLDKKTRSKK